ncbi:MAG: hypothetical protein GX188_03150 [Syntrophomonadaceae bacterium]|jgi:hypothetical protein|nr:hypothetical protein [Syntrophomonadaceae bacterium]
MKAIIAALPVLLDLWKSVLPLMFLGCFLGRLFLNTALIRQLGRVMGPLARLGHLPSGVDAPLTLCLVNEVAAYSMLAELKNNSIVNIREVVLFFLVSNLPKGLYNMVFYMAPVVLGALGMRLGLIYLLMYLGVFSAVGFVGLLLGRLLLPPQSAQDSSKQLPQPTPDPLLKKIIDAAKGSLPTFGRIIAMFVPVTFLVITLMQTETVIQWLSLVDPVLRQFGLPAPVLIVITTGMFSMVAGIGTLGPFLQSGIVTPVEAIAALLLASAIHYFLSFWSSNLPLNVSFFGPRLGSKVSVANMVILEVVTCLVLGVVVLVW